MPPKHAGSGPPGAIVPSTVDDDIERSIYTSLNVLDLRQVYSRRRTFNDVSSGAANVHNTKNHNNPQADSNSSDGSVLREECAGLQSKNDKCESRVAELMTAVHGLRKSWRAERVMKEKQQVEDERRHQEDLQKSEMDLESLRRELTTLKLSIDDQQPKDILEELTKLKSDGLVASSELQSTQTTASTLKEELERLRHDYTAQAKELHSARKEVKELTKLKSDGLVASNQLKSTQMIASTLRERLEIQRHDYTAQAKELHSAREDGKELEESLNDLRNEKTVADEELHKANETVKSFRQQSKQMKLASVFMAELARCEGDATVDVPNASSFVAGLAKLQKEGLDDRTRVNAASRQSIAGDGVYNHVRGTSEASSASSEAPAIAKVVGRGPGARKLGASNQHEQPTASSRPFQGPAKTTQSSAASATPVQQGQSITFASNDPPVHASQVTTERLLPPPDPQDSMSGPPIAQPSGPPDQQRPVISSPSPASPTLMALPQRASRPGFSTRNFHSFTMPSGSATNVSHPVTPNLRSVPGVGVGNNWRTHMARSASIGSKNSDSGSTKDATPDQDRQRQ